MAALLEVLAPELVGDVLMDEAAVGGAVELLYGAEIHTISLAAIALHEKLGFQV
jgi:hypothetical protein